MPERPRWPLRGSRPGRPVLQPDQAAHVVGEVGETDLHRGAGNADGAHDEPHPVLLTCEHVLDLCADLRAPGIGPGYVFGQLPPRLSLLMDVAGEHATREERLVLLRAIGGVRPDA